MSSVASEHHDRYVKERDRRARFLNSKRWKWENKVWRINTRGMSFGIIAECDRFRISLDDITGRSEYPTIVDAKLKVLEMLDTGEAAEFLQRRAEKIRKIRRAQMESLRWSLAGV